MPDIFVMPYVITFSIPLSKGPAPLRRFMERTLFNPSIELENLLKSSSMDSHRFGQSEGSRGDIPV